LRQRPDRYAIRAGRNLPDKEFRYLRTVIVTAAVYRGFGRFTAASTYQQAGGEASLLPKLRDQFAEFLNEGSPDRLGILYPPTCVGLRYGHL